MEEGDEVWVCEKERLREKVNKADGAKLQMYQPTLRQNSLNQTWPIIDDPTRPQTQR